MERCPNLGSLALLCESTALLWKYTSLQIAVFLKSPSCVGLCRICLHLTPFQGFSTAAEMIFLLPPTLSSQLSLQNVAVALAFVSGIL